jgi:DNA polymerase-3 subunit alpha
MIAYGHSVQAATHNVDMFGGGLADATRRPPQLPETEDWPISVRLNGEKDMLGFYVSGHPLARFRRELSHFASVSSRDVGTGDDGREVRMGGIIQAVKVMLDKRGNQMAFVTIEDFAGSMELIVFSDCYEKSKEFVKSDAIILAAGRVSTREGQAPKLVVSQILPFERLSEFFNCRLVLTLERDDFGRVHELWGLLEAHRGDNEVVVLTRNNGEELQIRPRNLRVRLDKEMVDGLKELLGESKAYLAPAATASVAERC